MRDEKDVYIYGFSSFVFLLLFLVEILKLGGLFLLVRRRVNELVQRPIAVDSLDC